MYRRATFAIVVSRISMNVGTTTMPATIQGLTAGRLTAVGLSAMLLMMCPPRPVLCREWAILSGHGRGAAVVVGRAANGCRISPACGPVGGSL